MFDIKSTIHGKKSGHRVVNTCNRTTAQVDSMGATNTHMCGSDRYVDDVGVTFEEGPDLWLRDKHLKEEERLRNKHAEETRKHHLQIQEAMVKKHEKEKEQLRKLHAEAALASATLHHEIQAEYANVKKQHEQKEAELVANHEKSKELLAKELREEHEAALKAKHDEIVELQTKHAKGKAMLMETSSTGTVGSEEELRATQAKELEALKIEQEQDSKAVEKYKNEMNEISKLYEAAVKTAEEAKAAKEQMTIEHEQLQSLIKKAEEEAFAAKKAEEGFAVKELAERDALSKSHAIEKERILLELDSTKEGVENEKIEKEALIESHTKEKEVLLLKIETAKESAEKERAEKEALIESRKKEEAEKDALIKSHRAEKEQLLLQLETTKKSDEEEKEVLRLEIKTFKESAEREQSEKKALIFSHGEEKEKLAQSTKESVVAEMQAVIDDKVKEALRESENKLSSLESELLEERNNVAELKVENEAMRKRHAEEKLQLQEDSIPKVPKVDIASAATTEDKGEESVEKLDTH